MNVITQTIINAAAKGVTITFEPSTKIMIEGPTVKMKVSKGYSLFAFDVPVDAMKDDGRFLSILERAETSLNAMLRQPASGILNNKS